MTPPHGRLGHSVPTPHPLEKGPLFKQDYNKLKRLPPNLSLSTINNNNYYNDEQLSSAGGANNNNWYTHRGEPPLSPLDQMRPISKPHPFAEPWMEEEEEEDEDNLPSLISDKLQISTPTESCNLERFKGNSLLSFSYNLSSSLLPDLGNSFISALTHSLSTSSNTSYLTSPNKDKDTLNLYPTTARNPHKALVTINAHNSIILVANKVAERLFDYLPGKLAGMKIDELFDEPYRSRQRALVEPNIDESGEMVLVSGKVMDGLTAKGVSFPVSVWMKKVSSGDSQRIIVVIEPVERCTASFVVSNEGVLLACDPEFANVFGYDYETCYELIDQQLSLLIPSILLPQSIEEAKKKQSLTGRTKDNTPFPLTVHFKESLDDCSVDVSSLILLKGTVIVYAALSGMVSFFPNGTIHGCNHHFTLMLLGYSQQELTGKDISLLIPDFYTYISSGVMQSHDQSLSDSLLSEDDEERLVFPSVSEKTVSVDFSFDMVHLPSISEDVFEEEEEGEGDDKAVVIQFLPGAVSIGEDVYNYSSSSSNSTPHSLGVISPLSDSETPEITSPEILSTAADTTQTHSTLLQSTYTSSHAETATPGSQATSPTVETTCTCINQSTCTNPHAQTASPQTTSPHAQTTSTSPQTTSPHAQTISPLAQTTSPHAQTTSPHAQTTSPHAQTTSPHAQTTSPDTHMKSNFWDTQTDTPEIIISIPSTASITETQTDTQTLLQTNTQTDTQTSTQTDTKISSQTDIETSTQAVHLTDTQTRTQTDTSHQTDTQTETQTETFTSRHHSLVHVTREDTDRPLAISTPTTTTQGVGVGESRPVSRLSSTLSTADNVFTGFAKHKDCSLIPIMFQFKQITLDEEHTLYCVWLSHDSQRTKPHDLSRTTPDLYKQLSPDASLTTTEYDEDIIACAGEYESNYDTLQSLGRGAFGFVKLASRREDGTLVAVKFIRKATVIPDHWVEHEVMGLVTQEICILSQIVHVNIVQLLEAYENTHYFQLVMEKHGDGIDLFTFIEGGPSLDEPLISYMFRQVVSALSYLHERKILHRDVKDENIILNDQFHLKLIDFGSAAYMKEGHLFNTFCGTLEYCSPEVLLGNSYAGPELEMWSLGVTLYTLVFGENPFFDVDEIIAGHLQPPFLVSPGLMKTQLRLLHPDPKSRATLTDLQNDKWVNQPVDIEQYSFNLVRKGVCPDMTEDSSPLKLSNNSFRKQYLLPRSLT